MRITTPHERSAYSIAISYCCILKKMAEIQSLLLLEVPPLPPLLRPPSLSANDVERRRRQRRRGGADDRIPPGQLPPRRLPVLHRVVVVVVVGPPSTESPRRAAIDNRRGEEDVDEICDGASRRAVDDCRAALPDRSMRRRRLRRDVRRGCVGAGRIRRETEHGRSRGYRSS